MTQAFDVLVLGGGVAGVAAALAAAELGRAVALVRSAPGATALSAGGWRGGLPDGLARVLADGGLPYEPVTDRLPHAAGGLVVYDRAAPAQRRAVPIDGAVVCGIAGLPDFPAPALAGLWGSAAGANLASATLELGPTPVSGWSTTSLAAALERDPAPLADAIAAAVRRTGATRAILPAVLGLERSDEVLRVVEDAAGVPVGEALAGTPSLPGWRLDRLLMTAVEAAGVVVVAGKVVGHDHADGRIFRVHTHSIGAVRKIHIETAAIVLATGKFMGGGLTTDGPLRETALGCPVWIGSMPEPGTPDPLALTYVDRRLPQPLLAAGVRTDAEGRPVDRRGDVVYHNVWVAGSIRAGTDAAGLGLGTAAEDGWRAGEAAAREVG